MTESETKEKGLVERMFTAGAHFGYSKSRRHPSVSPFIFGTKNKVEIFDLEKTSELLSQAKAYARELGAEGKTLLFIGGKSEARQIVEDAARSIGMPYVASRWIGGTITNFSEIRKRISRLEELTKQRDAGDLGKYTKRERLMIDREIEKLEANFAGLLPLTEIPRAAFVIDPRHERVAINEIQSNGKIAVIGLLNSDCDVSDVDYPVVANDTTQESIKFFVSEVTEAYREGAKTLRKPEVTEAQP